MEKKQRKVTDPLPLRRAPKIENKFADVQDLYEKCREDSELVVFLRKNYYSVYCKGLVFCTINPRSIQAPNSVKKHCEEDKQLTSNTWAKYYLEHYDRIKEIVKQGMSRDQERKQQLILCRKHKDGNFVLCDFEFSIPGILLDTEKKPEIDLVALDLSNRSKPIIYFIEYKCKEKSLSGKAGVLVHYDDFIALNEQCLSETMEGALESYKFITKEQIEENCDVRFAFLFTDISSNDVSASLKELALHKSKLEKDGISTVPIYYAQYPTVDDAVLRSSDFVLL